MSDTSPQEVELTPDLIDYVKRVAIQECKKHCPKYVKYDDVVQEVLLHLISKPPKHDPSKGAAVKTLLHTIVQRQVLKYVARQARHAGRYMQVPENEELSHDEEGTPTLLDRGENRRAELFSKSSAIDDVLEFIDNEESRQLCRVVIDCGSNLSKAARRLGIAEGTVRYRLKLLAPKLRAAGFDPGFTPLPKRSSDDDDDNDIDD